MIPPCNQAGLKVVKMGENGQTGKNGKKDLWCAVVIIVIQMMATYVLSTAHGASNQNAKGFQNADGMKL